ncbi:predicted protein [Botrytis cinerea T4]|uniref:Uncharacterized protein n=1 Tax=Botryotinia fuckeliana (strain T4) TaxID=999810 RepID=G2YEH3_BOTF4|nr:predicted protein [Botrytis cinerea T4]
MAENGSTPTYSVSNQLPSLRAKRKKKKAKKGANRKG